MSIGRCFVGIGISLLSVSIISAQDLPPSITAEQEALKREFLAIDNAVADVTARTKAASQATAAVANQLDSLRKRINLLARISPEEDSSRLLQIFESKALDRSINSNLRLVAIAGIDDVAKQAIGIAAQTSIEARIAAATSNEVTAIEQKIVQTIEFTERLVTRSERQINLLNSLDPRQTAIRELTVLNLIAERNKTLLSDIKLLLPPIVNRLTDLLSAASEVKTKADIQAGSTIEMMAQFLNDPNEKIRLRALQGVVESGSPLAKAQLIALVSSNDDLKRNSAIAALHNLGDDALDELTQVALNPIYSYSTRRVAIQGLFKSAQAAGAEEPDFEKLEKLINTLSVTIELPGSDHETQTLRLTAMSGLRSLVKQPAPKENAERSESDSSATDNESNNESNDVR